MYLREAHSREDTAVASALEGSMPTCSRNCEEATVAEAEGINGQLKESGLVVRLF